MDTNAPTDKVTARRAKRRRALLAILLSSSLATLGAGAMSLAIFTDSATATGAWSTGTIVLGVDQAVLFNASAVMPGDEGSRTIVVSNDGTANLRYAVSPAVVDDADGLGSVLQMTIDTGACGSTTGNLYTGDLVAGHVGDSTQGAQAGDRVLVAGDSESLCFHWSLPSGTLNAAQGDTAEISFDFDAEQTKNN